MERIPDLRKKHGVTAVTILATHDANGPATPTTAIVATGNRDDVTPRWSYCSLTDF
ncbi:hypothetical protein [Streptomyces sp. NBC_00233]|uniref:hypothetical protein n=1 Tax=Streptomyces sp. NBC_00233 TaxID=2975686 RepID=UPI0022514608|nr:hypothetical protein [Streptomyces sp. NBC_00233]MCX5232804.1 hypothetical protein [Streptomyces sp. NBC_00233]